MQNQRNSSCLGFNPRLTVCYPWLQPVTHMEVSKRLRESSKTRYQPVISMHVKLKRSQRHESNIMLCLCLPDYYTGALLVGAGVHDEEVLAKTPRSFDGSNALHCTIHNSLQKFT